MPPKRSSPRTLDLFECTLTIPTPSSEPAVLARPPALASWSDAQLAQHLCQLVEEMRRRMGEGRGSGSELEAAVKQARESLQRLVTSSTRQDRPSRSSKTPSVLQEGQRKAVRAVLLQL